MRKTTKSASTKAAVNEQTLSWLSAREEERLTEGLTPQELEALAIVKKVIRRDPEPQFRLALLTNGEEGRLQALGVSSGYIPNSPTTAVLWQKEGFVLRYSECVNSTDGESALAPPILAEAGPGKAPGAKEAGRNEMTTKETQDYWGRQVALGRLIARIITRDPDYENPKYEGLRKIVNDVSDEEAAQLGGAESSALQGNTHSGFAPIPVGGGVKAHEQFYWELTGTQLRVSYCLC
jgi:hypothetical protein